ncbi:unnamed protein product [Arctia plantaginis]|uniref:Uncharacterized protein n=1 Tax=Arctia plantaginis TaxID=874455 RepID=A0A8S0Z0H6_ARCPL|nr:unnamed protein product [Arctia plantaginis]
MPPKATSGRLSVASKRSQRPYPVEPRRLRAVPYRTTNYNASRTGTGGGETQTLFCGCECLQARTWPRRTPARCDAAKNFLTKHCRRITEVTKRRDTATMTLPVAPD